MRVGMFGGSFDPVHVGHCWIAEAALEQLELDSVLWIPAAVSPLKPDGTAATSEDRLAMLRLAIAGASHHQVDDREIRRGDVSYTVDTVAEVQRDYPDAELVLIIGSDSLASFPKWHRPQQLLSSTTLAVVQRGGEPEIDFSVLNGLAESDQIERTRQQVIRMPVIEISSTELRNRVAAGQSIRYRTPRAVEAMIKAQGIYQS